MFGLFPGSGENADKYREINGIQDMENNQRKIGYLVGGFDLSSCDNQGRCRFPFH